MSTDTGFLFLINAQVLFKSDDTRDMLRKQYNVK